MKKITLVFLFALSACTTSNKKEGTEIKSTNESLDVAAFQSQLTSTPNAVLLDVRTPEEFEQGTIPGSVNINFNGADFEEEISALAKDKPYFVYCAKGGRSSKAVARMNELGFTTLYNLEGGYNAWSEVVIGNQ